MGMDGGMAETKVVFGEEKEITERKGRLKNLRGYKTDLEYLLDEAHEKSKALTDLMVTEGLSDEFIRLILREDTDDAYMMTLDFLHCAALIMGEDYVKENLMGKTISVADAANGIKETYHEQQLKPYREIYENLDERLKAAREGETLLNHQIEILKIQSSHAQEMYDKAMENEKLRFKFEKSALEAQNTSERERSAEKISALEGELSALREKAKKLEKENRDLRSSYEKQLADAKADTAEGKFVDFSWRKKRRKKEQNAVEKKARTAFALSVLGNKEFSAEQIAMLVPVLENEKIPLAALERLCVPSLPAQNMKAFIRFLEGGTANEAKQ